MKHRFILFQRAGIFYCEDTSTGKQTSLRTRDKADPARPNGTPLHSAQLAAPFPAARFRHSAELNGATKTTLVSLLREAVVGAVRA
jgi:hypothetical protein